MSRKLRHDTSINEREDRDQRGRIIKKCCCVPHQQWTDKYHFNCDDISPFKIKESKRFALNVVGEMRSSGLLTKDANTLCTGCYQTFKKRKVSEEEEEEDEREQLEENEEENEEREVDTGESNMNADNVTNNTEKNPADQINKKVKELFVLLSQLDLAGVDVKDTGIDIDCISQLLYLLADKFVSKNIFSDGLEIKGMYKDAVYLENLNSMHFLLGRNNFLLAFLCGCFDFNIYTQTNTTLLYAIAVVVEMVYFLRNMNLILPHSFLLNLTQMFVSGSKTVSVINGKISPAASYTSYSKWLQNQGSEKVQAPLGDVIVEFDNVGKYVRKNWRVESKKIKSADIVTTVLFLETKSSGTILKDHSLKPSFWRPRLSTSSQENIKFYEDVHIKMDNLIEQSNLKFKEARELYFNKILDIVQKENAYHVKAHMQDLLGDIRSCGNCGKFFLNLKRKCDAVGCNGKVTKVETQREKVTAPTIWKVKKQFDIGQTVNFNKVSLHTGDAILVNPNSYDSVNNIAINLHEQLRIGEEREWAPVGCDGPPYALLSRLIDEKKELDWILPVPGIGHLHMNQLKTFFRVADEIFLHPLGDQVLNFSSTKAYNFFVNAKDTHKSYQALEILLHGTVSEFCREYITECKNKNISYKGFMQWAGNQTNETFNLIYQLIFNYAFAIYVQKVGVRCNDSQLTDAGRYKFMPLFYGFNHPIYQEIEYRDMRNKVLYPEAVARFMAENTSFSTHTELDHQGADFCLEGKIKRMKMMAPKGVISKEVWQRISRSVDKVERIQKHLNETLGNVYDEKYRDIDIYDEMCKWRATVRLSNILKNREEVGEMLNIYDEPLSPDLDDLTDTLNEKMKEYWQKVATGIPPQNIRGDLLHVKENCTLNDLIWSNEDSDNED